MIEIVLMRDETASRSPTKGSRWVATATVAEISETFCPKPGVNDDPGIPAPSELDRAVA